MRFLLTLAVALGLASPALAARDFRIGTERFAESDILDARALPSADGTPVVMITLTEAAAAHSNDMVFANFFSHTGSDGSTLTSRVDAAGYGWSRLGENIAVGQTTINQVVDGWMASDGHCANIMNAAFRDIGVACVSGRASNTYRSYWTMDLARPR